MRIALLSLADSAALGRALARTLIREPGLTCPIFLQGEPGAGKTTLVRFLTQALPGGAEAEVSSPSFTLCNIYPTRPEILHFDLYRLEDAREEENLAEALEEADGPGSLLLLEWPERLPASLLPASFLYCRLTGRQNDRRASFESVGEKAGLLLEHFRIQALRAGLDTGAFYPCETADML
jgi:tRNA threonylcarbamoyladenosine biosynthesis protein TsaE